MQWRSIPAAFFIALSVSCGSLTAGPDGSFELIGLDADLWQKQSDAAVQTDSGLPGDTDAAYDACSPDSSTEGDAGVMQGDAGADATAYDAGPKECPENTFASARDGEPAAFGGRLGGSLAQDCDAVKHYVALAAGQKLAASLWGDRLYAALRIYGPGTRGLQAESVKHVMSAVASLDYTADIAGEYFVVVSQAALRGATGYTLDVKCLDKCDLKATRFPIILAHGCSGFANIGPINYFYDVKSHFSAEGYTIFESVTDAFNHTEVRGRQLAAFIDSVLAQTYARKVNIIGHSQGGLDSRFAISGLSYGDRVGMLNTVSTPHHGTEIADWILKDPTGVVNAVCNLLGIVLDGPDSEQKAKVSFESMRTDYMENVFNVKYPDDPRVAYRSWAGKTCFAWDGCGDDVDLPLVAAYTILHDLAGDNDGIVPTYSGKWSGYQGVLDADHVNQVGQLLGVTGGFDHYKFYSGMIESMRAMGF